MVYVLLHVGLGSYFVRVPPIDLKLDICLNERYSRTEEPKNSPTHSCGPSGSRSLPALPAPAPRGSHPSLHQQKGRRCCICGYALRKLGVARQAQARLVAAWREDSSVKSNLVGRLQTTWCSRAHAPMCNAGNQPFVLEQDRLGSLWMGLSSTSKGSFLGL